jgi:hypothetical protein
MKLVELGVETARKRDPKTASHVMRFQPIDAPLQFGVNDSIPELVIANNHSGRAKFTACGGIFRFVCSNGMIVPAGAAGCGDEAPLSARTTPLTRWRSGRGNAGSHSQDAWSHS